MTVSKNRSLAWPLILTFLIIMVWMPFEGIFRLVITVGLALTALWAWVLHYHYKMQMLQWFSEQPLAETIYWVVTGGMAGLIAPAMILGLMILKTGIHSHGPEFNPLQIRWVVNQFSFWPFVGLLIGLGIGLLTSIREGAKNGNH